MKIFDPFLACLYCGDPVENFEPGPKGGASQNVTCRRCGARYTLAMLSGNTLGKTASPTPAIVFLEVLSPPRAQ